MTRVQNVCMCIYICCLYTHTEYTHHTLKQRGKMANNLSITLQKSSFKTVFNQLRQRLKMNGEVDRHTGGKDRREVVRDLGNSL